jgi:3'-5' exonuclease
MLLELDLTKVLFLDIETVPQLATYEQLDETTASLWNDKASKLSKNESTGEEMYERAGIYAEFGKIICISVGYFLLREGGNREFRMRSFYGDDEKVLLTEFAELLNAHYNAPNQLLCGHNGKEKTMGSAAFGHYGALEIRRLEKLYFPKAIDPRSQCTNAQNRY